MRLTVRLRNGEMAEAVVLAAGRDRMRVVVAGHDTTEEWFVFGRDVFDENGRIVEIEAVVALEGMGDAERVMAAGGRTV